MLFTGDESIRVGIVHGKDRNWNGEQGGDIGRFYMQVGTGNPSNPARYAPFADFTINDRRASIPAPMIKMPDLPTDLYPILDASSSPTRSITSMEPTSDTTPNKFYQAVFTFGVSAETDYEWAKYSGGGVRFPSKPFFNFNPKTLLHDMGALTPGMMKLTPFRIGVRRQSSQDGTVSSMGNLGYYGGSHEAEKGANYVVTHSLPLAPTISLGSLQNSLANGFNSLYLQQRFDSNHPVRTFLHPGITHAIGNSFAPSILAKDKLTGNVDGLYEIADHSYLANLALWDDYFFSSIAPTSSSAHHNGATAAKAEQKTVFTEFASPVGQSNKKLPNAKMMPYVENLQSAIDELFPASASTPIPADKSAAYLMVDGGFNVNSTSVAAWKALLLGLKGSKVPTTNATAPTEPVAVSSNQGPDKATPIPSLTAPGGGPISDSSLSNPNSPEQWKGFRSLSDTQIGNLANALVKQVRERGPFLSLSDFVNRRPQGTEDEALEGVLQAALDDPTSGINVGYNSSRKTIVDGANKYSASYPFPKAEEDAAARGIPGYVKQGDILTSLAPLITVRGDTFLIRAYGDSRDKSGKNLSQGMVRGYCPARA